MDSIEIGPYKVGKEHRPMVVAELSGNHNGNLSRALMLIEAAKEAGADAVKFQTYTPDTMTIKCDRDDFKISEGPWRGHSLYDLYQWAHTPWEWHSEMFAKAKSLDLIAFSTPFDESAVDFLRPFDPPAYKVASFELPDIPLIEYIAEQKKPVILSTGMANEDEIKQAINAVRDRGNDQLILLHCVSAYPAQYQDYHLKTIEFLRQRFNLLTGLSDHTLTNITAVTSVALGSCFIEKHFTLSRSEGGPDAAFSLDPAELKSLCRDVEIAWRAMGEAQKKQQACEETSMIFRRSLFSVEDIAEGELFTAKNVRRIRPGYGLPPKYYRSVLGKKALKDISRGTPLNEDMIDL